MPAKLAILIATLSVFWSVSASAFDTHRLGQQGSLFLSDIASLIDRSPKLKREIVAALAAAKTEAGDVLCYGARFPGTWRHLGGERVAPYVCKIGDRLLEIDARVRLSDGRGRRYDRITPTAMRLARNVKQDRLTWRWSMTREERWERRAKWKSDRLGYLRQS